MTKFVKITAGIIASLFTIAVAIIALTIMFVQPDFVKKKVSDWVQKHTDRELTIDGQMHWTLIHGFGLTASDVTLSNPKGFEKTPFAHAKTMTITFQLVPLIKKEFAINHIRFDRLDVNLINKPSDVNNWSIKFQQQKQQQETAGQDFKININRITLKNSSIHINNQRSNTDVKFNNVYLYANNLHSDRMIYISGNGKLEGNKPNISSSLSINGKVLYDNTKQLIKLENFELVCTNPNQILSTFTIYSTGKIDLKKHFFDLSKLEFNFANEISAKGYLIGTDFMTKPKITGHLTTNRFNLKNLLSNLGYPIKTNKKNALNSAQIDADINVHPGNISLDKIVSTIDGVELQGNAELNHKQNTLSINLRGDKINLDDYQLVPAQNRLAKAASKISKTKTGNHSPGFSVHGHLQFKQVQTGALSLANVTTSFNYAKQILNISKFSAAVFDGSTRGSLTLNFNGKIINYRLQQSMVNINLSQMLKTLIDAKPISGRANIDINLSGRGTRGHNMQKSLRGNITMKAKNGIMYGVDIDYQVARVVAHMSKDVIQKRDSKQSVYNNITAQLKLSGGVISNPSLSISLPRYHIKGSGTTNFITHKINYSMGMKPLYPLNVKTLIGSTDLSQYYIPLTLTGTLQDPDPSLNFQQIIAITIKKQATDVIKKTIKNQFTDKLKNIFKDSLPFYEN